LQQLGFARPDAIAALCASAFDVERAAEFLLLSTEAGDANVVAMASVAPKPLVGLGRFRKRAAQAGASECTAVSQVSESAETPEGSLKDSACGGLCSTATSDGAECATGSSSSSSVAADESDEALAWRLQLQDGLEGRHVAAAAVVPDRGSAMSDSEIAALALELEDMEQLQHQVDPALVAAQFQEYDSAFMREDAEAWNGHGDLMHSPFSREHLDLETMEKSTLFSVGHGDLSERDFWEVLQCHSIRVLYDVRQTDSRGELYSRHQRFSIASLRAQCRNRGIFYKPMPIGRESAYGALAHIKTDEGRHTLVELVWQAKRKRTAFLGKEEYWRDDARQVAAEELVKAGHIVEHVRSDGSTELHPIGVDFPDWLVREESRLKLLEKKRHAGELAKPQKSSVDRSSEAIASRLARPTDEVDAMAEMRGAANQKELIVAQRKLVRYQRIAEEKGLLAAKVVKNTPEWILEDSRKQAEWVAARKKEKADAKIATEVSSSSASSVTPTPAASSVSVEVPGAAEALAAPFAEDGTYNDSAADYLAEGGLAPGRASAVEVVEPSSLPASADGEPAKPSSSCWRGRRRAAAAAAAAAAATSS